MHRVFRATLGLFLVLAATAVGVHPASAAATPYGLIKMIPLPNNPPPAGAAASFDISWVDPGTQRYFVSDKANYGVTIIDAANGTFLWNTGGFVGSRNGSRTNGGPNGVTFAPDMGAQGTIWAGDGDGFLKGYDVATRTFLSNANTVVTSTGAPGIPTGGALRADELAYDPDHHLIVIGDDQETPPLLAIVSTTQLKTIKTIPLPDAVGLEQPVYDPIQKVFLVAVPNSTVNTGGEVLVIDPVSLNLARTYALNGCNPNGAALGPNENLLLGCGHGAAGSQINTQIINATNGSLIKNITQTGAPDEVWYNPGDNRYYLGATGWTTNGLVGGPASPSLGIIDASNNSFVENVPVSTSRSGNVAANPVNNWVFMSIVQPANLAPLPTQEGIGVFGAMGGQNFQLMSLGSSGNVQLNWVGVPNQPSYTLSRIGLNGTTTDISVPGGATNVYTDNLASGQGACYQLLARDIKGAISWKSDVLCALPGSGVAAGPRNVNISLRPDAAGSVRTATLNWTPPSSGTVANYMVLPVGTTRIQILGSSVLNATDATGGAPLCYIVGASNSAGAVSVGDIVCAIPNTQGFN